MSTITLLLHLLVLAAAKRLTSDGQCIEGDANTPATCASPAGAAGLDSCCERLVVCEKVRLTRSQPSPTAVASPAIDGAPLSDGLRALLTRDQEEEALPFLVSSGHSPGNLSLTEVDDGDLSALAELLARAPKLHTLGLPSHALSLLGVGAFAATVRDAAPQLERLRLGEFELPLAPLRPAAKSASLVLRGKALTVHDLVVVTTFLRGGGGADLETLDLANNAELGALAGTVVAEGLLGGAAPALRRLHLDGTSLGDAGAAALAAAFRAGAVPRLVELTLTGNGLSAVGVAAMSSCLGDATLAALEVLDLSTNEMAVGGAGAIALGLRAAPAGSLALRSLRLDEAGFTSRAAELITAALPAARAAAPALNRLSLLRNRFDADAAQRVVGATEGWADRRLCGELLEDQRKGHALNLAHKRFSDADAILVAASLRDAADLGATRHLWLHNNGFGDRGLRALLPLISTSMAALTHLSLNDNGVGDAGGVAAVEQLLAAGALPLIEEFWLSGNQLAARAAHALVAALEGGAGPKLRNLWLRDNPLFDAAERSALTVACKGRKVFCQLS